ncbi:MAG: hypothetical protein JW783_01225 [Bacteroidales bacterium]|nr:hypothetical protein [Bacteroidales bacterium]MBN2748660.1 hypothetical protein [Bacteroidales bacterium]
MSWKNDVKTRYMLYRMGYYAGQAGIMRRFLGEEGSWHGHLSKTKQYILDTAISTRAKKVRILGSGWLLDIPINELVRSGVHVTLVDIAHPRQVMHRYSGNPLIAFETADVTGGAVQLAYAFATRANRSKGVFEFLGSLAQLSTPFTYCKDELVVSANILSQTSVLITDYLLSKRAIRPADVEPIARLVQENHLNAVLLAGGALVADYEEEYFDDDGAQVGIKPTIYIPLRQGQMEQRWTWTFDTKETYSHGLKTNLNVAALLFC